MEMCNTKVSSEATFQYFAPSVPPLCNCTISVLNGHVSRDL